MKKLIVLCTILTIASGTMMAGLPFINFGAKVGMTSQETDIKLNNTTAIKNTIKNATGYHVGLVARVKLPVVFIQPELLYNWYKTSINATILGTELGSDVKINSFEVPLMLGARCGLGKVIGFRVNAGPVFNLATDVSVSNDALGEYYKSSFNKQSVTWTAGLGIDLFSLMLDVRYNGQFKKNSDTIDGIDARIKQTSWSASLGILF